MMILPRSALSQSRLGESHRGTSLGSVLYRVLSYARVLLPLSWCWKSPTFPIHCQLIVITYCSAPTQPSNTCTCTFHNHNFPFVSNLTRLSYTKGRLSMIELQGGGRRTIKVDKFIWCSCGDVRGSKFQRQQD